MTFTTPKTYLIGCPTIIEGGLRQYLLDTGNEDFWESVVEARAQGLSDGEILCSFYAKLCYKSLTLGHNANVTRIRDIPQNLEGVIDVKHGSVFEHCNLNFVVSDCSRIFTHEQVRHRVGVAYSQTSGRFVALDKLDVVFDPILEPVREEAEEIVKFLEEKLVSMRSILMDGVTDFDTKKKITSALRRFSINGATNEIGITENIRTLRQVIEARTSRHAEWEIRVIYAQIAEIVLGKWPLLLHGHKVEVVDDIPEYTNLRI